MQNHVEYGHCVSHRKDKSFFVIDWPDYANAYIGFWVREIYITCILPYLIVEYKILQTNQDLPRGRK